MQVKDVLDNLVEMFPRHADVLKARLDVYKTTLTPLAGDRLTAAYQRTMKGWSKEAPPWPKEIVGNAPDSVGKSSDVARTEQAYALQDAMLDATIDWYRRDIDAASVRHGLDKIEVAGTIRYRLKPDAWKLAKAHVLGKSDMPPRFDITGADIEAACDGVKRAAGWVRAGKPGPMRAPAVEEPAA